MAASRVSTVRAIKGPQNCFQISLRSGRLMPKARSRFPKKMRPFRSRARATTHTTGSFAMGQHLMCLRNFGGEHRYFRQLRSFKERLAQHERADVQHAAHIYEYLSEQYFFQNDSLAVLNGTLASLNLAERCGAVSETIRGYSALALGMAMSGMVRVARSYGKRAQRLAEEHGSLPEMARVRLILGVLSYGLGEWNEAEQNAQEAKLLYGRLGDRKRAHNSETMAIFIAILRGNIAQADRQLGNLLSEMSDDWPVQVRAWSLASRVLIDTIVGQAATEHLNGLKALARDNLIRTDQLLCLGVAAMAHFKRRETDAALELADRGLAVLQECGVVWGGYVFGAAGIADVYLGCCESASGPVPADLESRARLACRQLSRLARTSAICRPYALLMQGRASFVAGNKDKARRRWEQAAAAETLQMPREQACAIYEIGKGCNHDDPNRQVCLEGCRNFQSPWRPRGPRTIAADARSAGISPGFWSLS